MNRLAMLKPLLPLIAGFLLLLTVAGGGFLLVQARIEAASRVSHTLEVANRISRIEALVLGAEAGQRGFLLTGAEAYLAPYQSASADISSELAELRRQTMDNASQQDLIPELDTAITIRLSQLSEVIALQREGKGDAALDPLRSGVGAAQMQLIREILQRMNQEERRLLAERTSRASAVATLARIVLGVALLLIIALGFFTVRDMRRRILELQEANQHLVREASERQAAEAQVRHFVKMDAIGQLTGGIAHDFNNMMAIVTGAIAIARRRLTGSEHPSIPQCLDAADSGARRAAELTARLLAFSRKAPLAPQVLDATALVTSTSELLRRTLGEGHQIETVIAGGLWRIHADPSQIESSLVNLAVNARDAMPNGGKLTIETANAELDDRYARTHAEVTPGQYVMISVTDTGTGMPPAIVEKAFEPFFTTKEVGKGTGLGLSQVFGFVKQSGGHVKIYSEEGRGTTVKIYLPRYVGGDSPTALAARPAPATGRADEVILVVEDDAAVRAMSISLLRELGYTVIEAAGPSEALASLESNPGVALLFTDIVMPEMTGRELADKARKTRPTLKVLYTTGYTRNAVVHNGVLDPGTPFLPKPFTLDDLATKVRETIDQKAK
jgi:signal transduction histidine kinase/ActR/RegA family two-component response regulator